MSDRSAREQIVQELAQTRGRGADATQEIDASDVLETIDVSTRPSPPRAEQSSASSIAPMNLSAEVTCNVRAARRRRELGRYVVLTVAACVFILMVGVVRKSLASEDDGAAAPRLAPSPVARFGREAATSFEDDVRRATAVATGTIRIDRAAAKKRVWIDGVEVTSQAVTMACGAHQLKVGARAKSRAIDVPCGGDIKVSR